MSENKNNNTESTEDIENIENENINSENEVSEEIKTVETVETEASEIVDAAENSIDVPELLELPEIPEIQPMQLSPTKKNKDAFKAFKESILGTTAILAIICVVTVFVVSLLHSLTAPVIEKRLADEKHEAVVSLFSEKAQSEILTGFEDIYSSFAAPVTEVIIVKDKSSQKLAGYCVTVAPQGFADEIIILVAINPDITVKDTKILSMNETSGIGTKIENENWFGDQFKHKKINIKDSKTEVNPDENAIQIIAGATKSSKAFLSGINAALDVADEIKRQMTGAAQSTDITEESNEPVETIETEGEENPDE